MHPLGAKSMCTSALVLPHEDDAAGWCGPAFRELP
jgi:hypothetical protein